MSETKYRPPSWLYERNNDPYGTDNRHAFWQSVTFEQVGNWRIFERDGFWFGYDNRYNSWWHFDTRDEATEHAGRGSVDTWT